MAAGRGVHLGLVLYGLSVEKRLDENKHKSKKMVQL